MNRIAIAVLLALVSTAALAQQRTIYGADGKVIGHITTDSAGSKAVYDEAGRTAGRTATDSQGTTTFYDAAGRKLGTVSQPERNK